MSINQQSLATKYLADAKATNGVFYESLAAISNFDAEKNLYQHLRSKLKKVTVDGEDFYIAEGDTLLDEAQLEIYALQKESLSKARQFDGISDSAGLGRILLSNASDQRGLIGISQNGKLVRWEQNKVLSFCILRKTFVSGNANYQLVRENFLAATKAWENTCGIRFEYKQDLDDSSNTNPDSLGVVFVIREFDTGGNFIAAAFFPNDPTYRRRVLIDPTYYSTGGFDKIGVLRHELGHVLGFRHEHIRPGAPSSCPDEEIENTIELTQYDSKSVMHYLCGGVGDPVLNITAIDKIGAQKLYGLPFNEVVFVG